ncbi:hypothetical protein [Flaviaesturariibacter amylovorans]|uniref:Type VI secretion system baseplate subunit TssK n=1 Tax=Flaviaesturariibacter amylovorans TaxID=1084520 RepID=A0ABP8HRG4_9BACT
MNPYIKYQATNWIDGMKIHKQHFVDSENALLDAIRDANSIARTPYSFGLLSPGPGDKKSVEVKVLKAQSSDFKISLTLCRAVTIGGIRIEILPQDNLEIFCEDRLDHVSMAVGNSRPESFMAILTANPFNRQPAGDPDPSETPPRNPYTRPRYEMHIIAEEDIAVHELGAFHIPVARFERRGDEVVLDNHYIPPCATIKGHPAMVQHYNTLGTLFSSIQEYSTSIVQKIVAKSQNTPLAQNVRKLCAASTHYIASIFFAYRNIWPHHSPVYIAEGAAQLANWLKVELDFMPEKEKEEMLQYFKEWNEINPSAFEDMLANAMELQYDHFNIQRSFGPVFLFLSRWKDLLEKLNELELIGRRKEKDFILREQTQARKKGFSLLD